MLTLLLETLGIEVGAEVPSDAEGGVELERVEENDARRVVRIGRRRLLLR